MICRPYQYTTQASSKEAAIFSFSSSRSLQVQPDIAMSLEDTENWADLDKNWQTDGIWGVTYKILGEIAPEAPGEVAIPRGSGNTNLFRDEYHAPV